MRTTYDKPPRTVDISLPSSFSDAFIACLTEAVDYDDYGFKGHYLRDSLLSKYCDPKTTSQAVRKSRAIEKWRLCEHRNELTNNRIFLHNAKETDLGWTTFPELLARIRSFIARLLGPVRYPDIILDICHTNGASTRVRRSEMAAVHKLMGEAHISSSALKHWLAVASNTRLSSQNLVLQENSVLFTVPKNSDIDRVACKEPEINMLMQRSVGSCIRRKLRRVGIDLNDQTVNQRLAGTAVKDGLATIDLSSASDSISTGLVEALLPSEWFSLLDDLRVKTTSVDGQEHELNMFSSMGNGFTFELESLLFYAITSVVCKLSRVRGRISVYGDDIIAPATIVPRLKRVFDLIGFKTNEKKTFWTGLFRESCGKHYHGGFDVTPFFVRRRVSTLPDLINILNQLMEWSGRGLGFIEDPKIRQFHEYFATYVPSYLWGGVDPQDNTCLVTGHAPRYRLVQRLRTGQYKDQDAALLHWFMAKESVDEPVNTVPAVATSFIAKRCSRGWTTAWKPWLLQPQDTVQPVVGG